MSDFIKVNFKNGHICIMPKSAIRLHRSSGQNHYVTDCEAKLSIIAAVVGCQDNERKEAARRAMYEAAEITREEYDRLCKELGVEIENNSLDCFHDYKFCDNRCAKCGILYKRIGG